MTIWDVKLEVLTGVHIASGEELTPLDFSLLEFKQKGERLVAVSLEKVISNLNEADRREFLHIMDKENHALDIHNFLTKERIIAGKAALYDSAISSGILKELHNFSKGKTHDNNRMYISKMIGQGKRFSPYIPGSSIKGMVRTAVLSSIIKESTKSIPQKSKDIEPILLQYQSNGKNSIEKDPFRHIKVEDCIIEGKETRLITALKNWPGATGIDIRAELLRGTLMGGDAKGSFKIIAGDNLRGHIPQVIEDPINNLPWTLYDSSFEIMQFELSNFYKGKLDERNLAPVDQISKIMNEINPKENECLIRLGKYGQGESKTIQCEASKPWKNPGKSRTLADYENAYYPLGWCKLKFEKVKEV